MTNKTQRTIVAYCDSQEHLESIEEISLVMLLGEKDHHTVNDQGRCIRIATLDTFKENQNNESVDNLAVYNFNNSFIKFITYQVETTLKYYQ